MHRIKIWYKIFQVDQAMQIIGIYYLAFKGKNEMNIFFLFKLMELWILF
jgi:hypothetical protein